MGLFDWSAPNPALHLLSGHSSALRLCSSSLNLAHFLSSYYHHHLCICFSACLEYCSPNSLNHSFTPQVCLEDTTCLLILNTNLLSYTLGNPSSLLKQAIFPFTVFTDPLVPKSIFSLLFIIICLHGSGSSLAPSSWQPL